MSTYNPQISEQLPQVDKVHQQGASSLPDTDFSQDKELSPPKLTAENKSHNSNQISPDQRLMNTSLKKEDSIGSIKSSMSDPSGKVLGKRANTSILIENYEPKHSQGLLSGMSKIIPPSKRPTLDSKLLFDHALIHDKFLSTQSTVLQSPHTPSGSLKNEGQSLLQKR